MKQKSIHEAIYEDFLNLYNQIGKVITFNPEWHSGLGDINGVVTSETRRIIMTQGEYAKMTDNYGRKIILIGSYFGTIAVYPNSIMQINGAAPELAFYMTASAAHAIGHFTNRVRQQKGLIRDNEALRLLKPVPFTELMDDVKAHCQKHTLYIGDGLPRFVKEKKKCAEAPKQFPKRGGEKTAAVKKKEAKATEPRRKINNRPRTEQEAKQRDQQRPPQKPKADAVKPQHLRDSKRHPELKKAA
jgi:hypothetical protein